MSSSPLKTRSRSQSPRRSGPSSPSTRSPAMRRSVSSSLELGSRSRLRIQYENEELRARFEANLLRLFVEATDPDNSSTNTMLAKKALKYRRILDRVGAVNPQDAGFDASKVLGVTWVKQQFS